MSFSSNSAIAAVIPLKLNSRRLPNKNFLSLGGLPLCAHIFRTLSNVKGLDVYCYCSNPFVMDFLPSSTRYLPRDERFNSDDILGGELFASAIAKLPDYEHILISHATSPFVSVESFQSALDFYLENLTQYDSVIACRKFDKYAWFNGKSLNYNPFDMQQTNYLTPVIVETSGFYFFSSKHYLRTGSRIGTKPYFWQLSYSESIDIDTESDFREAQRIFNVRQLEQLVSGNVSCSPQLSNDASSLSSFDKPKLIVFDFDGVLIDSRRCMELAWSATCSHYQLDISFSSFFSCVGMKFDDIMSSLGISPDDCPGFADSYFSYAASFFHEIKLFDGVLLGMAKLRAAGYLLAINTSKRKSNTTALLKLLFSGFTFDFICTPDDILSNRGKPAPDSLLLITSSLGVDPSETIYVGDMSVDQDCALRAGVRYYHAGWGFGDFARINTIWFECFEDFSSFLLSH